MRPDPYDPDDYPPFPWGIAIVCSLLIGVMVYVALKYIVLRCHLFCG